MSGSVQINGEYVAVPKGMVAYKYGDPTEGARWIRTEAEAMEISRETRV